MSDTLRDGPFTGAGSVDIGMSAANESCDELDIVGRMGVPAFMAGVKFCGCFVGALRGSHKKV